MNRIEKKVVQGIHVFEKDKMQHVNTVLMSDFVIDSLIWIISTIETI